MSEEMNNELEEVIIVTATDDQGNEVEYQEVQRLDLDGKVFACSSKSRKTKKAAMPSSPASTRKTAKTSTSHRRTKSSTQPMQNSMNS